MPNLTDKTEKEYLAERVDRWLSTEDTTSISMEVADVRPTSGNNWALYFIQGAAADGRRFSGYGDFHADGRPCISMEFVADTDPFAGL